MSPNPTESMSERTWRAGVGVRCITPEKPIWLYGYANEQRFKPSIGVLDDLYTRAIAFEDITGSRAVIVTVDLCTPRKPLSKRIVDAIGQRTGIPRERVLFNASHTHSGPALAQDDVEGRFPVGKDDWRAMVEYTEALPALVADAAADAIENLTPAHLSCSRGEVGFVANRRKLDDEGQWTGMGPYAAGPVDRVVPVLRVEGPNANMRAIVFGCACHNVTLDPRNLLISADYAGFAREAIEREYPGATAIYVAGCGADANTEPRGGKRQWMYVRQHGQALGAEVSRVLRDGTFAPLNGRLRVEWTEMDLPLLADLSREELERRAAGPEWQALNAKTMLAMLDRGEPLPESYLAPLSLWRFGDGLDLVGIPGEVTVGYAYRAAEVLPAGLAWVAGYCHEVFGYLPTAQIVGEGGYEIRGLVPPGTGYFSPAVEETVVAAIKRLAETSP